MGFDEGWMIISKITGLEKRKDKSEGEEMNIVYQSPPGTWLCQTVTHPPMANSIITVLLYRVLALCNCTLVNSIVTANSVTNV